MGGRNVKNTIVERMLQIVAPHHCFGCGNIGTLLCADCKNDIINEPFNGCIVCGVPSRRGICQFHHLPIERTFVVGERVGTLEKLINATKFAHLHAGARTLAELLDDFLPGLPGDAQLVPIPTAPSHIRHRGYDHVDILTRLVAEFRDIPVVTALERRTNLTQHVVNRRVRHQQAQTAFASTVMEQTLGGTVIIIDDVITTGATVVAAAQQLAAIMKPASAIWVVAMAYQPYNPSTEQ